MRFKQHVPGYCSGIEPFEITFNSAEELLANEWIQRWSKDPGFSKYSVSTTDCSYPEPYKSRSLMAEFNDGYDWWVLGHLDEEIDLPIWEAKYAEVK